MNQSKNALPLLHLDQVSGGYSLNRPVLHDVSFQVKSGEMVALIGLNGAGKSTTMKHILGLLQAHRGSIRIFGKTLQEAPEFYRSAYAYVPETPLLYEEMTVGEHLELSARAYGLDSSAFAERSEQLLNTFNMNEARHQFSMHLSKGMRQKVMIMSAFLVQPNLYVIDEPFLGLDPLGIRSVLDLMREKKREGAGLLISSHILSMIEKYCDRFVILHKGVVIANGPLQEICRIAGQSDSSLEDAFYALVKDGRRR